MKKVFEYLKLMRPKQWVKNSFVLGALLFSGSILNGELFLRAISAFVVFCLASSAVYILNDIVDIEKDRAHPKKCKRPLASGAIRIPEAIILNVFVAVLSISLAYELGKCVFFIIVLYLINNIIYSFKVKNVVLLDVFSIAIGFVLRVLAGAVAINVEASSWILLCTFFIALYLGFGKRKGEILLLKDNADNHRKILNEYSESMLNNAIVIVLSGTIVFYAMYAAIGAGNESMVFTTIFVVYGVLRYNYLMELKGAGGSPTDVVTSDKALIIDIILWVISCVIIMF